MGNLAHMAAISSLRNDLSLTYQQRHIQSPLVSLPSCYPGSIAEGKKKQNSLRVLTDGLPSTPKCMRQISDRD